MQPLLIRREEFQELRAVPASPVFAALLLTSENCSVQKALSLFRPKKLGLNFFHVLKNKSNGDEKSQLVL